MQGCAADLPDNPAEVHFKAERLDRRRLATTQDPPQHRGQDAGVRQTQVSLGCANSFIHLIYLKRKTSVDFLSAITLDGAHSCGRARRRVQLHCDRALHPEAPSLALLLQDQSLVQVELHEVKVKILNPIFIE